MTKIKIATVRAGSPAQCAGLARGDEIVRVGGETPCDVLDYSRLAGSAGASALLADGRELPVSALSGAVLDEALFDGVHTCDNHCSFCFIFQLPPEMRRSLYLRDDDFRLSALYGNFTTLTRFTEADLERVVDEHISPLHVSIHTTDPKLRATMLRNPKGAMSLRWMRALLDHGIEVHGQIVCCPGINDGAHLDGTLAELISEFGELASVGIVPLGVSRFNTEAELRMPTRADAEAMLDSVEFWQAIALDRLGRRFVHASDEVYLLAGREFPSADDYEGFPQHENGIGMARALDADLTPPPRRAQAAPPWGYRAERRAEGQAEPVPGRSAVAGRRIALMTGTLGAEVIEPLVQRLAPEVKVEAKVVPVANGFFGGNIGVTGLLTASDLVPAIRGLDADVEVVVPDVILSEGRTLDEATVADLRERCGRDVRVVTTDGAGLREALGI